MNEMNNNTNEMEQKQIAMYGLTVKEMVANYLMWNIEGDVVSMQMFAMGMLSDIQERMAMGFETDAEELRQALNRAKYWMSEVSRIVRRKEATEPKTDGAFADGVPVLKKAYDEKWTDSQMTVLRRAKLERRLRNNSNLKQILKDTPTEIVVEWKGGDQQRFWLTTEGKLQTEMVKSRDSYDVIL